MMMDTALDTNTFDSYSMNEFQINNNVSSEAPTDDREWKSLLALLLLSTLCSSDIF